MNLDNTYAYFEGRAREIGVMCNDGTPWVFLAASAMLDYLAKLVAGADQKAQGYKAFVRNYLGAVRPLYRDFKYRNGGPDLPEQMYHVLRCGIVHSFSFIPDELSAKKGGRDRSIVLCHRIESSEKHWHHLMAYSTDKVSDAALFVAEDFSEDIALVVKHLFKKAKEDSTLSSNIERWVKAHPPIMGGF